MIEKLDFNTALKPIQSGQAMTGKDGVLAPLIKQLTESALEAELESHIADDVLPNRKNGKSSKRIKTSEGDLTTRIKQLSGEEQAGLHRGLDRLRKQKPAENLGKNLRALLAIEY
jgi:hypothetical protein